LVEQKQRFRPDRSFIAEARFSNPGSGDFFVARLPSRQNKMTGFLKRLPPIFKKRLPENGSRK